MNNLKRFNTEAEYQQASLNYPAVSWVTGTDTVHFDKTAPVVANNKVPKDPEGEKKEEPENPKI